MRYSQEKFGEIFNYSGQQISNFENCITEPNERFIEMLKARYGADFGLTDEVILQDDTLFFDHRGTPIKEHSDNLKLDLKVITKEEAERRKKAAAQVFEPEIEMYLNMARQILTSGQTSTINALKSNLIAFHEQVQDKARLKAMTENIEKLNKEIKSLKTITGGCVETSAARETGNE